MSASFGEALRQWRKRRRFTQMDLAGEAEVSTRHLSCLETGKATPSRTMALTLAEVLDVPMEDTNRLLALAGFAPAYRARGLEGADATPVREAIAFLLKRHHPYPALVVDPGWNVVVANDAYVTFVRWLAGDEAPLAADPDRLHDAAPVAGSNVLVPLFDRARLRPLVSNFGTFAAHVLQHLRRAARHESVAAETLRAIEAQGELPSPGPFDADLPIVVPLEFAVRGETLRLFTTMTMFGSSADSLLSSLRIETFFPVDRATDDRLRALIALPPPKRVPAPGSARRHGETPRTHRPIPPKDHLAPVVPIHSGSYHLAHAVGGAAGSLDAGWVRRRRSTSEPDRLRSRGRWVRTGPGRR